MNVLTNMIVGALKGRVDFMVEKLQKLESLDERAYSHIKDAVLKCTLAPGEFLPEVRLADEMGISKTPIRKAMARLQQEGFLVNIPYKGYTVAEISVKDITEIYELRQILECQLIQATADLFTPEEFDAIEADVALAQAAIDSGDAARYVLLNRKFHHSFDVKYGSARISRVLVNLDEHVQRIIFFAYQNEYDDLLEMQRYDHGRILAAVRQGEVSSAVTLMRKHLLDFGDTLVRRMS